MSANNLEVRVKLEVESDDDLKTSSEILRETLRDEEEVGDGYSCQECGKVYKTSTTLSYHRELKHPASSVTAQCTLCDKKYPSQVSLRKHVLYKHRFQHRCETCYRSFECETMLDEHKQGCLSVAAACKQCGKVYRSAVSLRNHARYKHPSPSAHWCAPCRRSFRSARGLNNHRAVLHSATVCHHCQRDFASTPALRSHTLYRHSRDTFRCQRCYKMFHNARSLERHTARMHARAHECEVCASGFSNVADLDKHVIDTHQAGVTCPHQWSWGDNTCWRHNDGHSQLHQNDWLGTDSLAGGPKSECLLIWEAGANVNFTHWPEYLKDSNKAQPQPRLRAGYTKKT